MPAKKPVPPAWRLTATATRGSVALSGFLASHRIPLRVAGEALSVAAQTVWQWSRGIRAPSLAHRQDIETWTRGSVPVASWGITRRLVAPYEPPASPAPGDE
jgi:hypothetical protein